MHEAGSNWAKTYDFTAATLERPSSLDELQALIASNDRVRALGSRHSFTALADTSGVLVSLEAMPPLVEIDTDARTATVAAGLRYGDVAALLQQRGWALHNMASLPHISVGGSIATGTHGSGDGNGTLATAVAAIDLVTATGDLLHLERGDPDFAGAVVSLGALGIVSTVTLDIQPSFEVRQDVFTGLTWDALTTHFDAVTSSAYSVSVFNTWAGPGPTSVWLKSRMLDAAPPEELFGARPRDTGTHMLEGQPPANTTTQGGVPGPWNDRLPHFKLGFTPSNGDEIQSEYLIPRENALAAIEAMRAMGSAFADVLMVTELRTMSSDDLWLSPAYGRETVGVHFTWHRNLPAVYALLPAIEQALVPLGARPHWGKAFVTTELDGLYPRIGEFRALVTSLDPDRKFGNAYLDRFGL